MSFCVSPFDLVPYTVDRVLNGKKSDCLKRAPTALSRSTGNVPGRPGPWAQSTEYTTGRPRPKDQIPQKCYFKSDLLWGLLGY